LRCFFHRNIGDGDERADVGGTHAGVLALVLAHVYHLRCFFDGQISRLNHGLRCAHEGDDRAVGGLAGVNVQEADALHAFDFVGDELDDAHVPAFGEIGDAFDELGIHDCCNCLIVKWLGPLRG
jgi:hypothetical protein